VTNENKPIEPGEKMIKIKYAIIGNGYRAMAFLRVGLALPEQFEITSVLFVILKKQLYFQAPIPYRW